MKIKNSLLIQSFVIAILLTACQKEETTIVDDNTTQNAQVDPALQVYFDRFEEEGRALGYEIDLAAENISGAIEAIHEEGVAGSCTYGSFTPGSITIDRTFWNNASNLLREMVVFHELGHCYLHRGHEEGAFGNGVCRSIMRSGSEGCFDNYNQATRDYYLGELFENGEF